MNIKIGAKIKSLRREQKVTQEALAAGIGVTPQAISRWESENGYPSIKSPGGDEKSLPGLSYSKCLSAAWKMSFPSATAGSAHSLSAKRQ